MTEFDQLQPGKRSFRVALLLLIAIVLGVFVAGWLQGSPVTGSAYDSLSQLRAEQKAAGYVQIGIFGNSWPARLVETIEAEDQLHFVRKNGTPHSYYKFDGYRLKALRLTSGDKEVIVVLRSAENVGSGSVTVPDPASEDDWEREMRLIREERTQEGAY